MIYVNLTEYQIKIDKGRITRSQEGKEATRTYKVPDSQSEEFLKYYFCKSLLSFSLVEIVYY